MDGSIILVVWYMVMLICCCAALWLSSTNPSNKKKTDKSSPLAEKDMLRPIERVAVTEVETAV